MKKYHKLLLLLNRIIYISGAAMLMAGLALTVANPTEPVDAASGRIWTTTDACGLDPVDANHYKIGDGVFINGKGFEAGEVHEWYIVGKPGGASGDPGIKVAQGTKTADDRGRYCFNAYTVKPDDWGEYQVKMVGVKGDNYRVAGVPTATNTLVPPTNTNTPTNTATNAVTNTPTNTPTDTPTNTVTNTPTDTPTNTPTNTPTDTVTPTPVTYTPTPITNTPTNTATAVPPTATATSTKTPKPPEPTNTPVNTLQPPPPGAGGVLIPVTGAPLTPGMNKLSFGGLGLIGLGLVLSGIRKQLGL